MGFANRFTFEERKQIEKFLSEGITQKEISRRINRSERGLAREIKTHKNNSGLYNAETIQNFIENRRSSLYKTQNVPLTDQQKEIFEKMIKENAPRSLIRKTLKCSYYKIKKYIRNNYPGYVGGIVAGHDKQIENIKKTMQAIQAQLEILTEYILNNTK